jgi:hypothetical protein
MQKLKMKFNRQRKRKGAARKTGFFGSLFGREKNEAENEPEGVKKKLVEEEECEDEDDPNHEHQQR